MRLGTGKQGRPANYTRILCFNTMHRKGSIEMADLLLTFDNSLVE